MKNYKRLTKKEGWHKDIDLTNELGYSYIYQRLSELENKIEDGTLIDMPRIIHPNRAEWFVQYQYPNGVIQYDICFSEAEAEEKLEELIKNEK